MRETVAGETDGARIVDIERDDEDGDPGYEIEYVADGVKYELDVAPDGTLVRRHRD